MLDVIDEITGTEFVTVTGPDGKKQRVLRRTPRSEEDQKLFDQATEDGQ